MVRYFLMLIFSIIFIIVMIGYLWVIYTEKKENGKIPIMKTLGAIIGLLVGGFFFIITVPDLPAVVLHHTAKYEGKCEIDKFSGKDEHVEADFGEHSIWFDADQYDKVRAGSYYCKVEYYPHSEVGDTLRLYQTKGGKEVETK